MFAPLGDGFGAAALRVKEAGVVLDLALGFEESVDLVLYVWGDDGLAVVGVEDEADAVVHCWVDGTRG